MTRRGLPGTLLLCAALGAAGCSLRKMTVRGAVSVLDRGMDAFYEESDPAFAESALLPQLKLLEILLKNDPQNPALRLAAAQGFGSFAFLFLEGKDPARAVDFYERGLDYGGVELGRRMDLSPQKESDAARFEEGLKRLKAKDVPILFWTGYCWGGLTNLRRDRPEILADLPKVEKIMRRVEELSPGFFFGGAEVFLGAYYGSRPKMLGGNVRESEKHFDAAIRSSGGRFLPAKLLKAQIWAVAAQDREAYQKILQEILEAPADLFPQQNLANAVARRRAKILLARTEEVFAP